MNSLQAGHLYTFLCYFVSFVSFENYFSAAKMCMGLLKAQCRLKDINITIYTI